jgi:hypothetical protein
VTRRAVSSTVAWNSRSRSQVIAVSNVSDRTPQATNVSRRYGASKNAPRQLSAAPPTPVLVGRKPADISGFRPINTSGAVMRGSSGTPPWSAAASSARRNGSSTG